MCAIMDIEQSRKSTDGFLYVSSVENREGQPDLKMAVCADIWAIRSKNGVASKTDFERFCCVENTVFRRLWASVLATPK